MQKITDEVFALASELVRRFSHKDTHECNFALERAEFMSDEDFVYTLSETPYFLEKMGLAEILSEDWALVAPDYWTHRRLGLMGIIYVPKSGDDRMLCFRNSLRLNKMNVSGFYVISFKIKELSEWLKNEIDTRTGSVTGTAVSVPDGWGWNDETKGIYQFGSFGLFDQGRGAIGKIFHEAMNLFHESPQGISITSLSQRTGLENKSLRSRLHQINDKLKKFHIKFFSEGDGYYRIVSTDNNEN